MQVKYYDVRNQGKELEICLSQIDRGVVQAEGIAIHTSGCVCEREREIPRYFPSPTTDLQLHMPFVEVSQTTGGTSEGIRTVQREKDRKFHVIHLREGNLCMFINCIYSPSFLP